MTTRLVRRWLHDRLFPWCIAAKARAGRKRDARWVDSPEGRAYFESERDSHNAEAWRRGFEPRVEYGWQCLTCGDEGTAFSASQAERYANAHRRDSEAPDLGVRLPYLQLIRGRTTYGHSSAVHAGRCSHGERWQLRVQVRGRFLALVVRRRGAPAVIG